MSEALRHLRRVDPVMAQLIRRAGPYAVKPARGEGAYEALVQAVAHQQLTGKAARTILGRFYALYGIDGCPEPARLVATPDEQLRGCGFSRAKSAAPYLGFQALFRDRPLRSACTDRFRSTAA